MPSRVKPQPPTTFRMFDPRRGDVAFEIERFADVGDLARAQRANSFTALLISEGNGVFHADLTGQAFQAPALVFFNPYQRFFFETPTFLRGVRLRFHANFFCIETQHEAVGCNGVLFNDVYGHPLIPLTRDEATDFDAIARLIEDELRAADLAHSEILVSYLKVFLIRATRLKVEQQDVRVATRPRIPPALERLTQLIEDNYSAQHAPAFYAAALNITPKALGRMVVNHHNRTLTELIRERVLKHAKWQLLHTLRLVKEIAWEVGFSDELYFSRLFKRATGCAPTEFREFETAIRGGRNLSM